MSKVNRSRVSTADRAQHGRQLVMLAAMLALGFLFVAEPAFAQYGGGVDKVNTLMQNIATALKAIGVVTATVAIMWCAYKMMFKHASFSEIIMIGAGGVLAGAAAEIAAFLIA
jgi:type IV secretion system protein VirB2